MNNKIAKNPWIVDARIDIGTQLLCLLGPLLLWASFASNLLAGAIVYVLFQILLNMPHNFQTWTLSLLDPVDRQKYGAHYLKVAVLFIIILGTTMALSPQGVFPYLNFALLYWGYYHLIRQHFGFLRIYEKKSGGVSSGEARAYEYYLYGVTYLPLLLRFRDPQLMTLQEINLWVWHPILSSALSFGLFILLGLVISAGVVHHLYLWITRRPFLAPRALHLLCVTLLFTGAGLAVDNFLIAIVIVTAHHNIQYLGLTWLHNRNRAQDEAASPNPAIRWIQGEKKWIYGAVSLLYGIVILLPFALMPQQLLAALPLYFFVAFHYYVDARMWRFQVYPERGRWLRLFPLKKESI